MNSSTTRAPRQSTGTARKDLLFSQVHTPIGPLTLGLSDAGLHVAYFDTKGDAGGDRLCGSGAADKYLEQAKIEVDEYFAGQRDTFSVPLHPEGTPFQKKAWDALLKIRYGEMITYGEQAKLMNEPGKARAVGAANGKNPICLFIPCHRVIEKSGNIGGYRYGSKSKTFLLDLEQKRAAVEE